MQVRILFIYIFINEHLPIYKIYIKNIFRLIAEQHKNNQLKEIIIVEYRKKMSDYKVHTMAKYQNQNQKQYMN